MLYGPGTGNAFALGISGRRTRWGAPQSPRGVLLGPDFSLSPPAWAPLPPRPRIEAPRPGFDLSLTAWLGNFLRLWFLQRRGAWSAGEPGAAGTAARPQEGAPARGCGPGPGLGPAAAGRAGGGGSSSTRCSGSILQIPRSSKLHHSGNDDSVRIIQAPASLSSPSPPYLFGDFTIA